MENVASHLVFPRPKRPTMLNPLTLDDPNHRPHTLLGADDPLYFPRQLHIRHVSRDLTGMHSEDDRVVVLALELRSEVAHSHVKRGLGGGIGCEAVFHFAEVALRARVAGHEDDGADGDGGCKEAVGGDDGADGVGVEVECEFVEGAV
jgi:hypothetical protein